MHIRKYILGWVEKKLNLRVQIVVNKKKLNGVPFIFKIVNEYKSKNSFRHCSVP